MATLDDSPTVEPVAPPAGGGTEGEQWRFDRNHKAYVPRRGSKGLLYRGDDAETVEQAREREAKGEPTNGDKRPKRRSKKPGPMPGQPHGADLKELERTLAEALKAPGFMAATFGDEWGTEHFGRTGPYLARNLVAASEHNPWLRHKLEEAATGQDAMMKVVSLVGVGGALLAYALPPVVYYLNLPAPEKMRQVFGIPPRREPDRTPEYAASHGPAEPDADTAAAAAAAAMNGAPDAYTEPGAAPAEAAADT